MNAAISASMTTTFPLVSHCCDSGKSTKPSCTESRMTTRPVNGPSSSLGSRETKAKTNMDWGKIVSLASDKTEFPSQGYGIIDNWAYAAYMYNPYSLP